MMTLSALMLYRVGSCKWLLGSLRRLLGSATTAETKRHDSTYQRHFGRSRTRHKFMKRLNWQIWTGFIFSLVAAFSYPILFVRWPLTREFPWANLVLFAIALVFLFLGLRRAFKPDKGVVSKIFSS